MGPAGHAALLRPRVLHLDTYFHDQHLIDALAMLPELDEVYLGVVRLDRLGKFITFHCEHGRGDS